MVSVGLELELAMPDGNRPFYNISHNYYGESAAHLLLPGWKIKSDSSINPQYGYFGLEVVSPVMDAGNPQTFDDISTVLQKLRNNDAEGHETCGMHVHIDARGRTQAEIAAIKEFFRVNEFAFYGLNGEAIEHRMISEHAHSYCKTSMNWDGGKYCSLNTSHVGETDKNTVECRAWASTLDDDIVFAAIAMFYAVVERASFAAKKGYTKGHKLPNKQFDMRNPSPVDAMRTFTDIYFEHPQLVPAIDSETLEYVKKAMIRQAIEAEAVLNSLD